MTSADVARESGVSRTTVSYVLTGREGVTISEATRQRVRETALRLGYAPSAAARALRTGRSDLVLCVLPDWPIGPVIETLLDHLATTLAERGLSVLVHHGRGPRPLTDLWRAVTPRAVLGFTPFSADDERALRQAGIRVVGTTPQDDAHPHGGFEAGQAAIGTLQVEHLVGTGHRALGYAAPTDPRLGDFARPREAGVRSACLERGLAEPVVEGVDLDAASGRAAVERWLPADVTAVAAYNDEVALAVLAGLRELGLSAPHDLAVVGVDDVPAARLAAPPLTTVRQPIEAQARYLAAAVLAALFPDLEAPPRPPDTSVVVIRTSA